MRFEHSFTVTTDIETAWTTLSDFEHVAVCIPGAVVEAVDGDEVHGSIKVRLGSIGPTYKGTMTFVQRDRDAHRFVLKAHAETRTAGSATAGVVASLSEFGGATTVLIISDVEFTGKAGQLEASVIADAGTRLVRQFAQRLADLLAAAPTPAPPPVSRPTPAAPEPEPSEPAAPAAEESQMSQSEEPTPTPDRSADADIGDESPPQVMPQRTPTASSSPGAATATPDREPGRAELASGAPSARTQNVPPAAIGAVVVALLLLLLRRRRRKRRRD